MEELYQKNMMISYAMMIEKTQDKEELGKILISIVQRIDENNINKMKRILIYLLSPVMEQEKIEIMLEELKRKKGGKNMPNVLERIIEQEKKDEELKIARKLLKKGVAIEIIIETTDLTKEEIMED